MGIKKIENIILRLVIFARAFASPKMYATNIFQPVRVGIGNQNWSTFNYQKITLFGTSDVQIYEKNTSKLITSVPADTNITISLKDATFNIEVGEETFTTPETLTLECPNGFLGVDRLKRKGRQALYRTSFEIIKKPNTTNLFYLVNVLDLQDYLKGVVPNEMPVSFGIEALKAQAVAARNYVLSPRTRLVKEYDVVDSVASQVYFGANTEDNLSNRAVEETEGIIALYNWNLILAQYSSTAGGYTESFANAFSDPVNKKFPSNSKPYLIAKADMLTQPPLVTEEQVRDFYMNKPDSYDVRSPYYRWQKEWTKEELQEVLSKTLVAQSKTGFVFPKLMKSEDFGELVSIKPISRGESGKLIDIEIKTTKGTFDIQKELVIRRVFQKNNISLPSANVVFDFVNDEETGETKVIAYGGGFGHGVGMSQYGAGFMGKELKMPYDKILKHYYTGISLTTIPVIVSSYQTQQKVTQKIYLEHKTANLIIDNKFNLSKINLIVNGKETIIPLTQGISNFRAPIKIDISYLVKKGENIITFCYPLEEGSMKAARLYIETVNPNADKFGF